MRATVTVVVDTDLDDIDLIHARIAEPMLAAVRAVPHVTAADLDVVMRIPTLGSEE